MPEDHARRTMLADCDPPTRVRPNRSHTRTRRCGGRGGRVVEEKRNAGRTDEAGDGAGRERRRESGAGERGCLVAQVGVVGGAHGPTEACPSSSSVGGPEARVRNPRGARARDRALRVVGGVAQRTWAVVWWCAWLSACCLLWCNKAGTSPERETRFPSGRIPPNERNKTQTRPRRAALAHPRGAPGRPFLSP